MNTYHHRIIVIVTAVWVVLLPFLWVQWQSWAVVCPYSAMLPQYAADIAVGIVAAALLPAAWLRKQWAAWGLLGAAVLLPVLKTQFIGAYIQAWVFSTVLLLLAAASTRFAVERGPTPDGKHLAMRVLLVPTFGLAALGTAAGYLHFVVGAIAGFDGVTQGKYLLGPLLSVLCVLAAFALWRVWLIGSRLWRYGAYVNASPKDRRYDAAGLGAAAVAFIGFVAIAKSIERPGEVTYFGIILAPAACLAIIAFLWNLYAPRANAPSDATDTATGCAKLRLADLPGLLCGTAIGLLGVYYLVPRPRSGWGMCDWSVFYPLYADLWPVERPIAFDGCGDDVATLSIISGVLSLVCLIAGALAAVTGRNANAGRGASAAAIVVAVTLATLAIQKSLTPDAPHLGWVESIIAGLLTVVGAAWLGYVGGIRAVRWTRRKGD
jgi:hypothetical protein